MDLSHGMHHDTGPGDVVYMAEHTCLEWIKLKLLLLCPGDGGGTITDPVHQAAWLRGVWEPGVHDPVVAQFLVSIKVCRLFAIRDTPQDHGFKLTHAPPQRFHQLLFFVRDPARVVTPGNISQVVHVGCVAGGKAGPSASLLRALKEVYLPGLLTRNEWPEGVRRDFLGAAHRALAGLTAAAASAEGRTALYVPRESGLDDAPPAEAARHKDVTQRLESSLLHWSRQIKEVLAQADAPADIAAGGAEVGLLAEIEFWRRRAVDLGGIVSQLSAPAATRMLAVLEASGSRYLPPFSELHASIAAQAAEATDALRCLELLEEPAQALATAAPEAVPTLLPRLLGCVRFCWAHTRCYASSERLLSLLRRLGAQVVARCAAAVCLDRLWLWEVAATEQALAAAIHAVSEWRRCYAVCAAAVARSGATGWHFPPELLFATSDAFMQRCKDLQEVCAAAAQFAPTAPLPSCGGVHGPELQRGLLDVRAAFAVLLDGVRQLGYNALDVKAVRWQDDFARFKAGVSDLEVVLAGVMARAVSLAPTLGDRVELLVGLQAMARREPLRRCTERLTSGLWGAFVAEVNAVKQHLEALRRTLPSSPTQPRYAAAASAASALLRRLEAAMAALAGTRPLLPRVREEADALAAHSLAVGAVQQFIANAHGEWCAAIDAGVARHLSAPLLAQDCAAGGLLRLNFHSDLLVLTAEVAGWEAARQAVPYCALEVAAQREKLRCLREALGCLVREYNQVLGALNRDERALFHDRLRALDRQVMPALSKLTWAQERPLLEAYAREARRHCRTAASSVALFKEGCARIEAALRGVSSSLLLDLGRRRLYDLSDFEAAQAAHTTQARAALVAAHAEVVGTLEGLRANFDADSEDVQREWVRFTQRVDRRLQEALRACVKRSLQALSRLLNGDSKSEVLPTFRVTMVLERNSRVELQPTIQQLFDSLQRVSRDVVSTTQAVPRVAAQQTDRQAREAQAAGQPPPPPLAPFYEAISADEDAVLRTVVAITSGVTGCMEPLQASLEHFEKRYKRLWEADKDAYVRRYERANKPLSSYEADLNEYMNKADEIAHEETSVNVRFLLIDCGPLKQTLVGHCDGWRAKLTGLLHSLATRELRALHDHFTSSLAALALAPTTLEALAEAMGLHHRLSEEAPRIEARFGPLRDKYRLLERFEVAVAEEETEDLEALAPAWTRFTQGLAEAGAHLEGSKDGFRERVVTTLDGFVRDTAGAYEGFQAAAPFGPEGGLAAARVFINSTKQRAADARRQAGELQTGMDLFGIVPPPYQDLSSLERELALLEQVWGVVADWQAAYTSWKDAAFGDLKVEEMEESVAAVGRALTQLAREAKGWGVVPWLRGELDAFKATLPLLVDLRNPALRPRHWAQLREQLGGASIDPASPTFTLERVMSLRLGSHADFVADLSAAATKEAAVEAGLQAISDVWTRLSLDLVEYKGALKLRSAEEVFTALEDQSVTLSAMKGSKHALVFQHEVSRWQAKLAAISETVECILQVQRKWVYLESVFMGSDDMRQQLPTETSAFEGVHAAFGGAMRALRGVGNAADATSPPGVLRAFEAMDAQLEWLQKSLDAYLEAKRRLFPRFYFLSPDDLLDILGRGRDPLAVAPHLKKCFEGIKSLDLQPLAGGADGSRTRWEATALGAPDGEVLPLAVPLAAEGRPEEWLAALEGAMYGAVRTHLLRVLEEARGTNNKERWVLSNPGQLVITAGQMVWTSEVERALGDKGEGGARRALQALRKRWGAYLTTLTGLTASPLSRVDRAKVVALITIEVHARDAIDRLLKAGVASAADFDWVAQLRFYWDRAANDCLVKQVLSVFKYGYEYQGNNGRLVITPLTDRCYMTLGAALFTRRGGNPLGPAGTGKTETVKDFGKALARYVIVFNCSDGVDFRMTGRMFSGLAQTGAWACLDEFNRIDVEVLSVVAAQIGAVMQAVKEGRGRFNFLGQDIRLVPSCGIFVTMNPGYAGRSELPDNLKALLRPVSMMVPDFSLIAEISLFSEGFVGARALARKMTAIMSLSQQQLSKQDHYDYGLRSFIIPIARAAGALKRASPSSPEDGLLYRTMLDLIGPKLTFLDAPLFMALLADLFPGVEPPAPAQGPLRAALEAELVGAGLQVVRALVDKMVQIFDCKAARHGNMIVGKTGSGKSTAWRTLAAAMGKLASSGGDERFQRVAVHVINPLALSNEELYGSFEEATREWRDGVLAATVRAVCRDESPDQKWVLFDGPVDTLWIESMNTLLDDNKLLTLLSGERISLPPTVSLLFEVEDLSQASPATVSRAGMIYLNAEELGWRPVAKTWLAAKGAGPLGEQLGRLIDRCVEPALEVKRTKCRELVPVDRLTAVRTLMRLWDATIGVEGGLDLGAPGSEGWASLVEMAFLYCLMWGLGGCLDEEGRARFDAFMRELDPRLPPGGTCFDYCVDVKARAWVAWEAKLPSSWRPPPDVPLHRVRVPTGDTLRVQSQVGALAGAGQHALLIGGVGGGKTLAMAALLEALPAGRCGCTVNLSAQTTSNSLQTSLEARLEKRSKGVWAPPGGRRLVAFLDDLNLPARSAFGFLPPLELLKLWADHGFWYDRTRCEPRAVRDVQLLAAMAPPGGGRSAFSPRLLALFSPLGLHAPGDATLRRIFGTLLAARFADFDGSVRGMAETLAAASCEVYRWVSRELLPTPSKSHYLFNTRDLARLVAGIMQATKAFYDSREALLLLWAHEALRVLGDRMCDASDRAALERCIDAQASAHFGVTLAELVAPYGGQVPPFVRFLRPELEAPPYEAVRDAGALKRLVAERMEEYGQEPGMRPLNLVLFKDAVHHVCRLHRILTQPAGHAVCIGVGGSGRKSLARLAAYMAGLRAFSVEMGRGYRVPEWRDDLKALYRQAAVAGRPTMFLFDEAQIKHPSFLDDINSMLTSGEVGGLFPRDELAPLLEELRPAAKAACCGETQDKLYALFLERARANLHVVVCLSPVGGALREHLRMFPALVNCTTIDAFVEWPVDALHEVAARQLEGQQGLAGETLDAACTALVAAHTSVEAAARRMWESLKRRAYVTPSHFLEAVRQFTALMAEKREDLSRQADKLRSGVDKLTETATTVAEMQAIASQKAVAAAQAKVECEALLVEIVADKRSADEQEKQVNAEAAKVGREAEEANVIATQVAAELDRALPALREAEAALNVITKKDISELKAYSKPPALVELTLGGVMTVLRRPPTWEEAKKQLGDPGFMSRLLSLDKDTLDEGLLKKIGRTTSNPEFTAETVGKVSGAARGLCMWVRAMEVYGCVAREVAPKRARLRAARDNLARKQAALAAAQEQLAAVLAKVAELRGRYEESAGRKKALEEELADLTAKLARAERLVTGLAGERVRWSASLAGLEASLGCLPGDCALAAAFLAYAGPFPSELRTALVQGVWVPQVRALPLPASPAPDPGAFLADPAVLRTWRLQGLPSDAFSAQNAVIVTRGRRWPLMIDPQGQAVRWVSALETDARLVTTAPSAPDWARQVEGAVAYGRPLLLAGCGEDLDPLLEHLLAKSYTRRGSSVCVRLGDKQVEVDPGFRLYLTTALANPHYLPEVSSRVAVINFAVTPGGVEEQLLAAAVAAERPDLDAARSSLVVQVAEGKRKQAALEDEILALLGSATGSLLDNVALITSLDDSKATWEEVNASLVVAEATGTQLAAAAEGYRPVAARGADLYVVLAALAALDPMYAFSLAAYGALFAASLRAAPRPAEGGLGARIAAVNEWHTYAVFCYASRSLFERHKLLLAMAMAGRVLARAGQVADEEWRALLRGGRVLERSALPPNPRADWLSADAWDQLAWLEASLPPFKGLGASLGAAGEDWQDWVLGEEPEGKELPREWEARCGDLQRLLLLRALRPDRLLAGATRFVSASLGRRYAEAPPLDLAGALRDASPTTPLLLVLSAGVDPAVRLAALAAETGAGVKLRSVALGQGQAPAAMALIEEGVANGTWVFLANCHLMASWLPTLDKVVEGLASRQVAPSFRLWLSSTPTEAFPLALLQRSIKLTTEPPKGLRANLVRLYSGVGEDAYACAAPGAPPPQRYQRLLLCLSYFHALLLERRKFRGLGFNVPYDFNDTDWGVSVDLLRAYLAGHEAPPWGALRYLTAEATYGGRVTDEQDRRVLAAYMERLYCEEALEVPRFQFSDLPTYHIPEGVGSLAGVRAHLASLPSTDRPEAFGQHPNAEVSYLSEQGRALLDELAAITPEAATPAPIPAPAAAAATAGTASAVVSGGQAGAGAAASGAGAAAAAAGEVGAAPAAASPREAAVLAIAADLLDQVPGPFNLEAVMAAKAGDPSALHVVLVQEVERYNALLVRVRSACTQLQLGIRGVVVMSADLDQVFDALLAGRVPPAWLAAYPSLKPLGAWTRDLLARLEQLATWAAAPRYPLVYWLGGFTYPTAFLTAVLQTAARASGAPIDSLGFEFSVVHADEAHLAGPPAEGVYIKGLSLEGAGWDYEHGCLAEPAPLELVVPMPILHFRPAEARKRPPKGTFRAPLYLCPARGGTRERPSLIGSVDLRAGGRAAEHWVLRGTALMLALAT